MKVSELIAQLQALPPDANVIVGDPRGYFPNVEIGEPFNWHRVGLCVEIIGKDD